MAARLPHDLITVMAGYASGGILRPSTLRWIKELRLISQKLILVFDQDQLLSVPKELNQDINIVLICERHGAYDFGSYQRGLTVAERRGWLTNASHLLLCNDSVLGPFGDLYNFVETMISSGDPLWGITESYLYRPHLQSYFLLMNRSVFTNQSVRQFFERVVVLPSRHDVIQKYELGFSTLIRQQGFDWKAFLSADSFYDPRNGEAIGNLTAYPLCMLRKGVPLMKVKALKELSSNFDGISKTCRFIAEQYPIMWDELWCASPYRAFWRDLITVGVVLTGADYPVLKDRLAWIQSHPHPNLKTVLVIEEADIDRRAIVCSLYKKELKKGLLNILIVPSLLDKRSILLRLISLLGTDWCVFSDEVFWRSPGSLQVQIAHVAKNPTLQKSSNIPTLWSLDYCFTEKGFGELISIFELV